MPKQRALKILSLIWKLPTQSHKCNYPFSLQPCAGPRQCFWLSFSPKAQYDRQYSNQFPRDRIGARFLFLAYPNTFSKSKTANQFNTTLKIKESEKVHLNNRLISNVDNFCSSSILSFEEAMLSKFRKRINPKPPEDAQAVINGFMRIRRR